MAQLDAIVVGAGIAGLTCAISLARYSGVRVTVLERSPVLGYVGNGIQVPCNAGHVLRRLDLLDKLLARTGGAATSSLSLDYSDGRVLLERDLTRCEKAYGAPWILAHRADYVEVLLEEARRLRVEIRLSAQVEYVNFETPWLRLTDGCVHHADVIIGCDGMSPPPRLHTMSNDSSGLHSNIRSQLHPTLQPRGSGAFAYRALFTPTQLSSPALRHITASRTCRLWLGPLAHAVFYPVRSGAAFNLVLIVADDELNARCEGGDVVAHVREWVGDWDPAVREILDSATDLVRFPLVELEELSSWGRGCVTIMGDAAHPSPPYLGQGAAMAVEDATILGTLLGQLTRHLPASSPMKHHIPTVLNAYAAVQRPRTASIVAQSRIQGVLNHARPGTAARSARDTEYAAFDMDTCVSKSAWVDAAFNREVLGRDSVGVALDVFDRLVEEGAFDSA